MSGKKSGFNHDTLDFFHKKTPKIQFRMLIYFLKNSKIYKKPEEK